MKQYTITIQFESDSDISREQSTMFTSAMCTLARDIFRGVNIKEGFFKTELGVPQPTLARYSKEAKQWTIN